MLVVSLFVFTLRCRYWLKTIVQSWDKTVCPFFMYTNNPPPIPSLVSLRSFLSSGIIS